jgi:gliding motility-associated-like protein
LDVSKFPGNFLWQDNSTQSTYKVEKQGKYWVSIYSGCSIIKDTIVVNFDSVPKLNLGPDTVFCTPFQFDLNAKCKNAAYLWQDGSTQPVFTARSSGKYYVRVKNNCGVFSDTILIHLDTFQFSLGTDTTLCEGEQLNYHLDFPGATYLWQDLSGKPDFTISKPGKYWVRVKTACKSVSDTLNVEFMLKPWLDLGGDISKCKDSVLLLNPKSSESLIIWNDQNQSRTFLISNPGIYWAEVSNACGLDRDTISISEITNKFELGGDTLLCWGESLKLDVTQVGAKYLWNDNSKSPTKYINSPGYFQVIRHGVCGDYTDSILVDYAACSCEAWIPDAFTPDENFRNDEFHPVFPCAVSKMVFRIFNRWGELVYESFDPGKGWNGMYLEKSCSSGVYVYTLYYEILSGKKFNSNGTITLLK